VNELPRFEIVCPAQNFQKSALDRGAAGDTDIEPQIDDGR
jgi:hypothetical protein